MAHAFLYTYIFSILSVVAWVAFKLIQYKLLQIKRSKYARSREKSTTMFVDQYGNLNKLQAVK